MTSHSVGPLSICPAQYGDGADINTAEFTFVVEAAGGSATFIEAFGFYRDREFKDADDLLQTGGLEVPAGSPIAVIAQRVVADRHKIERADAILRRNVAQCPCDAAAREECPALGELAFLAALEQADVSATDPST